MKKLNRFQKQYLYRAAKARYATRHEQYHAITRLEEDERIIELFNQINELLEDELAMVESEIEEGKIKIN